MNVTFYREQILAPLEAYSRLGEAVNEIGTRLIGHVPHIAPRAFAHLVYAPLADSEKAELSSRLGRPIPNQFGEFLAFANGLSLFVGEMRVMGYVPLQRKASVTAHNYPSSIIIPNVSARLRGLTHDDVVVGWYRVDGTYVAIQNDGSAIRFNPKTDGERFNQWPDFGTWLATEIVRIGSSWERSKGAPDQ